MSAGRGLADGNGAALQIDAQAPLPNGTPIFDKQARLVGLVAMPHGFGEGIVAALGAARIAASLMKEQDGGCSRFDTRTV